jgi:hypothetical protein
VRTTAFETPAHVLSGLQLQAEQAETIQEIVIQANVYNACDKRAEEIQMLERLMELYTDEEKIAGLEQRLRVLEEKEAMAEGARACLNKACAQMEGEGQKFEICSRSVPISLCIAFCASVVVGSLRN